MNRRAEIATGTLVLIALVGLVIGFAAPKPKFLDGRSREADKSAEASAEVEKRVAKAVEAEQAKGAVVAASVVQIGVAAGQLPDSPQKTFISREAGVVLPPLLPPPDPDALLAAERRRVAILEGKLEHADKLYAAAVKDSERRLERAVKAERKVAESFAERREMDTQLAESAAYARGKDAVIGMLGAVAILCVAGWLYAGLRAGKLSRFARKIIPALDTAYDEAPDAARQTLDATVFDRLSKAMDGAEKKLVHSIRSKL
jgi:hypothetical protein